MVLFYTRLVALGLLFVGTVYFVIKYNQFVKLGHEISETLSNIKVVLKRRHNLVSNLIELLHRHLEHERDIVENIVGARQRAIHATALDEQEVAEVNLSRLLRAVLSQLPNFPRLTADKSFISIHRALADVEEAIHVARRKHNQAVRNFNVARESFPALIVAHLLKLREKEYFLTSLDEEEPPGV